MKAGHYGIWGKGRLVSCQATVFSFSFGWRGNKLKLLRLISSADIARILTTNRDEGQSRASFVGEHWVEEIWTESTYRYGFVRIDLSGNPECHFHHRWQPMCLVNMKLLRKLKNASSFMSFRFHLSKHLMRCFLRRLKELSHVTFSISLPRFQLKLIWVIEKLPKLE